MLREFWWGNLKARDRLEYLGVDGRALFKWILKTWDSRFRTGFIWLRIGTSGGLL
jgi:hypothetical protein